MIQQIWKTILSHKFSKRTLQEQSSRQSGSEVDTAGVTRIHEEERQRVLKIDLTDVLVILAGDLNLSPNDPLFPLIKGIIFSTPVALVALVILITLITLSV